MYLCTLSPILMATLCPKEKVLERNGTPLPSSDSRISAAHAVQQSCHSSSKAFCLSSPVEPPKSKMLVANRALGHQGKRPIAVSFQQRSYQFEVSR